ncbi:MAG TPA: hypothetical protein VF469_22270 [Kofleriaceae bacterium]
MIYLDDVGDGYAAAVERLLRLRGPVARLPLLDGLELCCDRNGLLLGLGLARRALAASLHARIFPRRDRAGAAPSSDGWDLDLDLGDWPVSGDFLLVRIAAGGELVDLTDTDVRFWEVLLGLDYILHR